MKRSIKHSMKTVKVFACSLVCCAAVFIGSGLKAEAAMWPCKVHDEVKGYTIVGHYTDTHIICDECKAVCTMHHDAVKITTYCTKCNCLIEEKVEDIVQTHSSKVCNEVLNHQH